MGTLELSVLLPCHNEGDHLETLVASIRETLEGVVGPREFEIVMVDDGSTDDTADVMHALTQDSPATSALVLSRNFGKEAAMVAALQEARGQNVLIMDADFQHPVELIPPMLEILRQGQVDQVIAKRDRKGDSVWRTLASRLYYRSVNAMIDVALEDGVGDFRMLSRRAVDALLMLQETNRFSKGLFSWIGFPTEVIEYPNVQRSSGKSSWSARALINYGIDGVLSFNSKPLRLVVYLGFAVTGGALLYLLFLVVQYFFVGVEVPGYVTTIAVVTLFGGAQLLALGVIGEYVGRLYQEVKRRPHYVVRERLGQREGR